MLHAVKNFILISAWSRRDKTIHKERKVNEESKGEGSLEKTHKEKRNPACYIATTRRNIFKEF